ncbi:MAG TPA: tetratricopeptide repeat protein, partial [Acidobacteriota bacterium]|nr:tetratricopeptide repeat protein [Acidobacteriota bacterium]
VAKEDSTQAIKDLTEAIRLNPRIDKSYSARGAAYSSKGEYDQAIVDLTEAIRLNPENSSAYNIRAFAWGKKGHYQKAIADANETIRLDPKFASAYQHRGYAYLKQTNLTQAIEDCTKAIQFDSENGRAYATRGQAYAAQGKRELALADYRKALEVNRKEAEEEGIPALLAALERRDTQPPTLEVRSPVVMRGQGVGTNTKTTVSTGRVTVAGIASDESGVAEVTVNGVPVKLDAQGNFSTEVALKTGDNQIMVTALDRQGNSTRRDLTVVRQESVSTSPISSGGKYYALVIGINQYVNLPRLKTAVMDAQEVAAVLGRDYGFETRLLLDQAATKDAILTALNDYRKQTRPGDTLLIYYAGHGEFDREVDKGYWIPVEARDDENVRWVSADDVTTNLKGMAAQHILVVSDSCYSGTIRDSQSSLRPADHNRYLVKMQEGRSRMVMSSGGKEPVADGGGGGHSIFAKAFLNGLKEMEADQFTAEELFGEFVKIQVTGGSDQIPEFNPLRNSGHEKGGLVFVRKP